MKITLVTETFPPEINGVAMTLSHLVEGLADRGHQMTVVRPHQASRESATIAGPYTDVTTASAPIPGYPFLRFGWPTRGLLLRRWRADRPDLVHVATEGPLGLAALSAAGKLGIPVSSSFHTNFHSYSRHYGFAWLTRPVLAYLRYFHNRTRITLSPTAELNSELTADGFANMRLMSRGVNTRAFHPGHRSDELRASWGAGPGDLVVVHVSRLAAEKNYPLLFKCWAAIRAQDPRAQFVIVSDGPLMKKLRRAVPWAHFTGFLSRDELARHYAAADLFLYPSMTETFGNVAMEGLASALPVVAFDYAAPARFIENGVSGITVPFGDEAAFLDAATRLAQDRSRRLALGAAGRAVAETVPWDHVVDQLEADFVSLVAEPPVVERVRPNPVSP